MLLMLSLPIWSDLLMWLLRARMTKQKTEEDVAENIKVVQRNGERL